MPTRMQDLKERLRALRVSLGLTQGAICARTGGVLTRDQWSKLETGFNAGTSGNVRRALAKAFGVSTDEIVAYLEGETTLDDIRALLRRSEILTYGDLPGWREAETELRSLESPTVRPVDIMGARLMQLNRTPNGDPVTMSTVIGLAAVFRGTCSAQEKREAEEAEAEEQSNAIPTARRRPSSKP